MLLGPKNVIKYKICPISGTFYNKLVRSKISNTRTDIHEDFLSAVDNDQEDRHIVFYGDILYTIFAAVIIYLCLQCQAPILYKIQYI